MNNYFEHVSADGAWSLAAIALDRYGALATSRLGPTKELLHSTFTIHEPRQRWVSSREPSINPAFAIAEVVWMLAGRNDAAFLNYWNPALPKFAGKSDVYDGAYGKRLKSEFGFDQIEGAYFALKENPDSRQVVMQIWRPELDFPATDGTPRGPDVPCNISSILSVREGRLHWLQIMRSNDLFLGSPHNFVQFTTMQEVISGWLGLEPGSYQQVCSSLHAYEKDWPALAPSEHEENIPNTDRLNFPKSEFDIFFPEILDGFDTLRSKDLTPTTFIKLLSSQKAPGGWQNLLAIAAADAARRRGWSEEMYIALQMCSNKALLQVWDGWQARQGMPIQS